MANVEFPDYMKNVSGTLKTITLNDGTKRKIIVTCSKTGKQRLYIREYKPRSTKITENEIKQRKIFAEAALFYRNLTDEQKKAYQKQWKKNNYCLNGKKYVTLRGYIIARLYVDMKNGLCS